MSYENIKSVDFELAARLEQHNSKLEQEAIENKALQQLRDADAAAEALSMEHSLLTDAAEVQDRMAYILSKQKGGNQPVKAGKFLRRHLLPLMRLGSEPHGSRGTHVDVVMSTPPIMKQEEITVDGAVQYGWVFSIRDNVSLYKQPDFSKNALVLNRALEHERTGVNVLEPYCEFSQADKRVECKNPRDTVSGRSFMGLWLDPSFYPENPEIVRLAFGETGRPACSIWPTFEERTAMKKHEQHYALRMEAAYREARPNLEASLAISGILKAAIVELS